MFTTKIKSDSQNLQVICNHQRLDSTTAAVFRAEVNVAIASHPNLLMINLSSVSYMDSSGLGCLISILKSVRSMGGEMVLCSINPQVQQLFQLTSVDNIFKISATCEIA